MKGYEYFHKAHWANSQYLLKQKEWHLTPVSPAAWMRKLKGLFA